jgi:hypothetical protein
LRAISGWLQGRGDDGENGAVGIGLSASLTNEDVYAWARLAQALGAKVYLLPRAAGQGDALLRSADKDCNTMGTQAILAAVLGQVGDADLLVGDAGALDTLILVDNGIACSDALLEAVARVPQTAVLASQSGALTEACEVVVPLTQLHAREGTIVNVDGWVQRIAAPLKAAVITVAPHVAAALLAPAEAGLEFTDKTRPAELFDRLATAVPAFAGLDYGEVGDLGRGLPKDGTLAPRRPRVEGTPQWEPDPVAPTYKRPFQLRRGA